MTQFRILMLPIKGDSFIYMRSMKLKNRDFDNRKLSVWLMKSCVIRALSPPSSLRSGTVHSP